MSVECMCNKVLAPTVGGGADLKYTVCLSDLSDMNI